MQQGISDDAHGAPETKQDGRSADRGTSPMDLITFLGRNKPYAWLFSGEVVNMTGAWLTYVATLTVAERYGQSSGMLIRYISSYDLVCIVQQPHTQFDHHPAPRAVHAVVRSRRRGGRQVQPRARAHLDVLPRRGGRGRVVPGQQRFQTLVCRRSTSALDGDARHRLLYVLVFLQFTIETFYEPARKVFSSPLSTHPHTIIGHRPRHRPQRRPGARHHARHAVLVDHGRGGCMLGGVCHQLAGHHRLLLARRGDVRRGRGVCESAAHRRTGWREHRRGGWGASGRSHWVRCALVCIVVCICCVHLYMVHAHCRL